MTSFTAKDANGWVSAEASGWFWAHEAIRADMTDTVAILTRLSAAKTVEPWEAAGLLKWWALTAEFIEHHHDNEERLFFPKIAERVELPGRLSADHKTLLEMLHKTDAALKAALALEQASDKPRGLAAALDLMKGVQAHMGPHLREEEADTLPAMMKAFKCKEFQRVEQNMIKAMPWWALPHLYRRLKGDRVTAKAHSAALDMPGFVFDLLIAPRLDRYDAEYGWTALELLTPKSHGFFEEQRALAKRRTGSCGCLAPKPKPQHAAPV